MTDAGIPARYDSGPTDGSTLFPQSTTESNIMNGALENLAIGTFSKAAGIQPGRDRVATDAEGWRPLQRGGGTGHVATGRRVRQAG